MIAKQLLRKMDEMEKRHAEERRELLDRIMALTKPEALTATHTESAGGKVYYMDEGAEVRADQKA